jgi:hypothetical protein
VRGAADATYLINSFGDELLMQLQLNVHRLVVVYRVSRLMRSMPAPLPFFSSAGALVQSMPGGNSAGATRRLYAIPAGGMSNFIAMPLQGQISSRMRRSSFIGAPTLSR